MIKTLHQLIRELEARSQLTKRMNLTASIADDQMSGTLLNLANKRADLDRVSRAIETLVGSASLSLADAEVAVRQVVSERHFYGAYCELGAYDWLARHNVRFKAQIKLAGRDVLNPNGCTIDGEFTVLEGAFDIKGMGFQEYVAEQFRAALERQLSGMRVSIDGRMDIAVKDIEQHAFPRLATLRSMLASGGIEQIPELGWTIHAKANQRVTISTQSVDPYRLAEENRYYPFKTAGQFCKAKRFLLIFAYAAQFNQALFVNFAGSSDVLLRSMARRAFIQLTADGSPAENFDTQVGTGVTIGDAAQLLSGLLFINLDNDESRLFLNPRATRRLTRYHVEQLLDFSPAPGLLIDDFAHDDY